MPITSSDISFKLSIDKGPGNSHPQPDPDKSLGGWVSTTRVVLGTPNNIFDDVSGDDNDRKTVNHRLVFVQNNHSTLTWRRVKVWTVEKAKGGTEISIAADDAGTKPLNEVEQQAQLSPAGLEFSFPNSKVTGISLGDIPPGHVVGLWLRRVGAGSPALNNDGVILAFEGDTAE